MLLWNNVAAMAISLLGENKACGLSCTFRQFAPANRLISLYSKILLEDIPDTHGRCATIHYYIRYINAILWAKMLISCSVSYKGFTKMNQTTDVIFN